MSYTAYYYDAQIKHYLIQFCAIFAGMQVETGKGVCGVPEKISVPVRIGSRDRVVAALEAGNTQNKPFTLPAMAVYLSGISVADDRRRGIGVVDKRVILPQGGVFPNDLKTITRIMPVPYDLSVDLSIYASNMDQLLQIMEQILMVFDPTFQVQTSDRAEDWTKITKATLTGINNEENYSPGIDRRAIVWTLNFAIPIWISGPMDAKNDLVHKIQIRLGDLSGFVPDEVDELGNLQPFKPGSLFDTINVDGADVLN